MTRAAAHLATMTFLHGNFSSRISLLAAVAFVATATLSSAAHADDEPAPTPARSPHETTMTALGNELEELRLRAKVEDAEMLLERRRKERNEGPRFGPGRLGRGSVVFPDLFGISSLPLAGLSVLGGGGLLFTGPVAFGFTTTENGSRTSSVGIAPSFDVFVSDRFTVGGRVVAFRSTSAYVGPSPTDGTPAVTTSSNGYSAGIAPRIGYVVPLTESIALWPQVGLAVNQSRYELEGVSRTLSRGVAAELEVGLLVPLGRHVVVRLAPTLAYDHAWTDSSAISGSLGDSEGDSISAGVRGEIGLAF